MKTFFRPALSGLCLNLSVFAGQAVRLSLPLAFSAVLSAIFWAPTLHAQALPTATGPGSYIAVGGGGSLFQTDYGQRDVAGVTVYADINPTWRYGVEAEARFLRFRTSEQVTQTDYLIGPRVALRFGPMRPYVKFLVGDGHIDLPFHYAQGGFLAYAPGAGVEYMVGDRIAIRAVDVEYQIWPGFPYGGLHPYGVSAGISFRLNPVKRFPDGRGREYRRWAIPR